MWLVDPKKYKVYYCDKKPYICVGPDMVVFFADWEKVDNNVYESKGWLQYKAIVSEDGKYVTLARFVTAELVGVLFGKGYIPMEIFEKAKGYAEQLNKQPQIYTDENVFDYADDDEDDGI